MSVISTVCVYCGSADGLNPIYYSAAERMGRVLAQNHIRLVYGAGKTGLMGAVADGVLDAGGEVVGVVPENLNTPQLIHAGLTQLEVVPDIQTRKAKMSALADAFITLPGGYGTLDEMFETLTWSQIGLHHKPLGILNVAHYYDPLLAMIDLAEQEKFIYAEHLCLLVVDENPETLLDKLIHYQRPNGLERWVNR